MLNLILRAATLVAVVTVWSGASAAEDLSSKTSTQSAVTVKVTPKNLQGPTWNFDVVFDTHSQELKDDLMKETVLVTPDGAELTPLNWKGDPPGSHHRKGVLQFKAPASVPSTVELRINRPGEPKPRSFQWELK